MKKIFFILILFFNNLFSLNSGQFFILTLPNTSSQKDLATWLSKTKPAGVMLLAQHVKNRQETKKLTAFLQNEAKRLKIPKLIIAIDWEGGIVSRTNETGGFFSVPAPKNLGEINRTYSVLSGKLIEQQMRDAGINMNFAPSLDLFDPNNFVLGSRTFSSDPEKIFELSSAFASGLESEGIIPVYKHFPGLGGGGLDTHLHQVEVKLSKKEFKKHVLPFKKILESKSDPFIMVTHAKYPNIFENLPATLSPKVVNWIKDKNKNAFLITDDFFMAGVQIKSDLSDLVLDSIFAGFNLIIYSAQKENQDIDLIEKLNNKLNYISQEKKLILEEQINKIIEFKNKKLVDLEYKVILPEKKLSKYLASAAIKEFYENLKINNCLLITADISKLRPGQDWFINNKKSYLAKSLEKSVANLKELIFDPKDKNCVNLVLDFIKNNENYKNIILSSFFYGQGVWNDNQKIIIESLNSFCTQENNINLINISLAHPYEQTILKNAKIFNLGSFSKPMLKEVASRLTDNYLPEQCLILEQLKEKLKNKKIGLLCHNASYLNIENGKSFLPDLLFDFAKNQQNNTKLVALFSPEHGLFGNFGATVNVDSQKNSRWDCPIYSLHGAHKKPTKEMLSNLDVLVIDLHEVGIRAFTYLSSLKLCLDAAAENNLSVIVIDSPNPIYFWPKQGPKLQEDSVSFAGMVKTPFIHGQTIGQIAKDLNKKISANLTVISLYDENNFKNYYKAGYYLPASPNLASMESVYCYPITVFIEGTNYSEGRGTNFPFQQIGAPWIDGQKLACILNSKKLPGIYFEYVKFTPESIIGKSVDPKHKNILCDGVFLHIYDLETIEPMKIAKTILQTLFSLYPEQSEFIKFGNIYFIDHLVGNNSWRKDLVK
ncbi:DUF1343 domain-containing protein [Candidatus Dependentiae bacterium]|nr:DUF1343 domain-containing protein [Candidatus Dependentiae bacterium]MBU4387233.1 DUF1343 domain-containing protein [Candidatus Dependentiae bacterium]MCG2756141.1 DUF1343 domain-containing protein [Candidatus Dependentiae bacterium]